VRIDLNADLGESEGTEPSEIDQALLNAVSSASIATGAHAGNPVLMRQTIRLARQCGVAVGAHPGFHDREHFGRRELPISPNEVQALLLPQLRTMAEVASGEGVRLQHVKLHGALYNMAARDADLARAVVSVVREFDSSLLLFGPPGSELLEEARGASLGGVAEVFADRAYRSDGSLAPRTEPAAVLHDAESVVARARRLVAEGTVVALDGQILKLRADTICVHGDTPGAARLAAAVRDGLEAAGIVIRAVGAP